MKEKKILKKFNIFIFRILLSINVFIIYILEISLVQSKTINVSNENEFKNALQNSNNPNIIITSSFNLSNDYQSLLNSNNKKNNISIKGNSRDIILSFSNKEDYMIFMDYDNISLSNFSFEGNIYFNNCKTVTISSMQWDGKIKSINTKDQQLIFNDINYINKKTYESQWGIYLFGGNYTIEDSLFYGSKLILENIIYVSSYDENNLSQLYINNSHFSGEYKCRILNINFTNLKISSSVHQSGFSKDCGYVI